MKKSALQLIAVASFTLCGLLAPVLAQRRRLCRRVLKPPLYSAAPPRKAPLYCVSSFRPASRSRRIAIRKMNSSP
jgi:hypothetical protein